MHIFNSSNLRLIVFAGLVFGGSTVSMADSIGSTLGLWDTGVDALASPRPNGTVGDPHYAMTSAPAGATLTIQIKTSAGGYPVPPWIGDDSSSAWIGPDSDLNADGPVGAYIYETDFTVSSAGQITISGRWATDDEGSDILVDGVSTGQVNGGYTAFTAFSFTESVSAGTNTLDFAGYNTIGDTPTGMRVEFESASFSPAVAAAPLPSTAYAGLGLLGGLGSLMLARRKAG
jgi:hypothetical protein